jgi:hypothetical protein
MARLGEDGETPIGRPVADSRLLVLGRHFEVLPRGVPGELYLGGRGLARGYLGRPELTARAFVPDPVSGEPGARLYRTGDLVRFRPDGQLEFLGRADRQVKVRGFRIEPGEIEVQIAEYPGVREAVVVPYEAGPRDLRLAAYAAAPGPDAPSAPELRAFLRARLPEHMVPSSFTFLPALPLTPGGKIDRRALPPPSAEGGAAPAGGTAAPATPTEELLAGIWSEVLGRTEIGSADDFFDLGGHSLLHRPGAGRVRAAFGVEVPVRAVFETRTLAALARQVDAMLQAGVAGAAPPPLARSPRNRPLPLSFAQKRLWFLDRLEPGSPVYNLALAFRLSGPLDAAILERSLDEVFRRHEVLRTSFTEGEDGEPHPVVAPFSPPGLPRADLEGLGPELAAAEARHRLALEAERPFDLERGPVARALLLRLGGGSTCSSSPATTSAFDGWSRGVRGGSWAPSTRLRRRPPSPPELAVQYADYAVWQRRWLRHAALETQLDYWRAPRGRRPGGCRPSRPRPRCRAIAAPPSPSPSGAGRSARSMLTGATARPPRLTAPAYAALLALRARPTWWWALPFANRREAGSGLIGFFVNTWPAHRPAATRPSAPC